MIKVVCVDESEGGQKGLKLLTNGKVYEAFTYPIMPLRIYFKDLRENNLNNLLDY